MKFKIICKKIDADEKVKAYVEKKLSKLDKFFKEEPSARVVLGTIKDNDYIEAQISAAGMIYRAEVSDKEILAAIDRIVDVIERQIRRNKTKLEKRIKRDAVLDSKLISGAEYNDGENEDEFEIVKYIDDFTMTELVSLAMVRDNKGDFSDRTDKFNFSPVLPVETLSEDDIKQLGLEVDSNEKPVITTACQVRDFMDMKY